MTNAYLLVVLIAVALSGCTTAPDGSGPTDAGDEPSGETSGDKASRQPAHTPAKTGPVPVAEGPSVVHPPVDWNASGLSFQAHGGPGEYVAVYHRLAEPVLAAGLQVHSEVRFNSTGAGASFVFGPALLLDVPSVVVAEQVLSEGGRHLVGPAFTRHGIFVHPEGPLDRDVRSAATLGTSEGTLVLGVVAAVASDSAWNASLSVTWGEGSPSGPAHVQAGGGAVLGWGAQRTLDLVEQADAMHLGADVEAGWNHLQIVARLGQPIEVNRFSMRLAGGHQAEGWSVERGWCLSTPVSHACSASAWDAVDFIGSFADDAGRLVSDWTFARGDEHVDLAYVHLPVEDFEAVRDLPSYEMRDWPFADDGP